jgi:hypothetical protein
MQLITLGDFKGDNRLFRLTKDIFTETKSEVSFIDLSISPLKFFNFSRSRELHELLPGSITDASSLSLYSAIIFLKSWNLTKYTKVFFDNWVKSLIGHFYEQSWLVIKGCLWIVTYWFFK